MGLGLTCSPLPMTTHRHGAGCLAVPIYPAYGMNHPAPIVYYRPSSVRKRSSALPLPYAGADEPLPSESEAYAVWTK